MTSTNPLQQTIEALAKEKGIEPDVVIQAMEEAVLTASRKFYKSGEDLKAKFNPENGQIELFAVKTIVDEVTNPPPRSRSPRPRRSTARTRKSKSATRSSSRSAPTCSAGSPRRPPSR